MKAQSNILEARAYDHAPPSESLGLPGRQGRKPASLLLFPIAGNRDVTACQLFVLTCSPTAVQIQIQIPIVTTAIKHHVFCGHWGWTGMVHKTGRMRRETAVTMGKKNYVKKKLSLKEKL